MAFDQQLSDELIFFSENAVNLFTSITLICIIHF